MNFTDARNDVRLSGPVAIALVLAAIAFVGWIDLATGAEIRILALYFLPLVIAGWSLGRSGALLTALLATAIWVGALYGSGVQFRSAVIWAVNVCATALGFLVVGLLVARLRDAFDRESLLSRTDQLTGLDNRRSMAERVGRDLALCRRNARAATLIAIDLNDFKRANDTFGHQRGDRLLCELAGILRRSVRATDTVARIGGDEFVVFLPEADAAQAEPLIARIRAEVEGSPEFRSAGVTVSIGRASEAPAESDLDAMLRTADADMYKAKRGAKLAATTLA